MYTYSSVGLLLLLMEGCYYYLLLDTHPDHCWRADNCDSKGMGGDGQWGMGCIEMNLPPQIF